MSSNAFGQAAEDDRVRGEEAGGEGAGVVDPNINANDNAFADETEMAWKRVRSVNEVYLQSLTTRVFWQSPPPRPESYSEPILDYSGYFRFAGGYRDGGGVY